MNRYVALASRLTVVSRCACLIGVMVLVFAIAAPVAYGEYGGAGVQAALCAAAIVFVGAAIAIVLASLYHGTPAVVSWILAGDAVAMALPLLVGFGLSRSGGELADAGVFGWIVLFFLVGLATRTLLVAPLAQQANAARSAQSGAMKSGATAGGVAGDGIAAAELGATTTKAGM